MTSKKDVARILQNMIDEAEENIVKLEHEVFTGGYTPRGYEIARQIIADRRADLTEAWALIEELEGAD
jgi:ferritin-like protein